MANSDLAMDPTYQAMRRAMGFDEGTASADADLATARNDVMLDLARPEIAFQGEEARRQISGGFEDRGMWGSGARLRELAVQRRNQGAQLGQLEVQGANSLADIQRTMAQQIAAGRRNFGDRSMAAGADVYLGAGMDAWNEPF